MGRLRADYNASKNNRISIKKQNLTKLKSGSFYNQEQSIYIFRSAVNNTLAQVFNPTQFEADSDSMAIYDNNFNYIMTFFTDGASWIYDDFSTIADDYILPANSVFTFGTFLDFDILVSEGAIIQRYYGGKLNLN